MNKLRMRRILKKIAGFISKIIFVVLSVSVGIAALVGFMLLAESIFAPKEYLFYEHHPIANIVMIWLIMLPVMLIAVFLGRKLFKTTTEEMRDFLYIWKRLGKWRIALVFVWIIGVYCTVTSVTYVTADSIKCFSPVHPKGIAYEYTDVDRIKTGFGNSRFAIAEYKKKGNFYYQIEIDGKKIVFHVPSVNGEIERYEEDSYLELEEFDQKLVELGVSKQADSSGYANCDLDKQYVERFLRIIELK